MLNTPHALLFDLDGTLIDTAPDLAAALNHTLMQHQRAPLPIECIRPVASYGAKGLIQLGFQLTPEDTAFDSVREQLLAYYRQHICEHSRLFPGIASVLAHLTEQQIAWGIVTNKPGWLTEPLLAALQLADQAAVIVSGDTCAHAKPHPAPVLYACEQLRLNPQTTWYLGDAARDIQAGRAAGCMTVGAAYGYIHPDEQIADWQADHLIQHPTDILRLLSTCQ
ncbi:MAG: phosphoglycolate phosphatase [Pseudomonadota bacterium]